jgi:hypothetical protein
MRLVGAAADDCAVGAARQALRFAASIGWAAARGQLAGGLPETDEPPGLALP